VPSRVIPAHDWAQKDERANKIPLSGKMNRNRIIVITLNNQIKMVERLS
jgi:hypothetical protein